MDLKKGAHTTGASRMNTYRRWIQQLLSAGLVALFALSVASSQADETITYIHWDVQGSPVAATDEAGNVVWRESYRPYGDRIDNEAATGPHTRWYTGHPQDPDTGLVYAGARYYDPVIGRFLAIDPVKFQEDNLHSFNRYAYGNNNPYRYIDPDGRVNVADPWSRFGGGGGGPGAISHWGGAPRIPASIGGARRAPDGSGVATGAGSGISGTKVPTGGQKLLPAPKQHPGLPTNGRSPNAPDRIAVDSRGNAIPLKKGETLTGSPDGRWIQVRDPDGNPTGTRIDGPHRPNTHTDPRALEPHGHIPGRTNPDGTPWLPIIQ